MPERVLACGFLPDRLLARGLLLRLSANPVVADDLGQETFLRAYRGLEHFEGRARFSTWIYRIAYNVFLNYKTRTKQFGALPDGMLERRAAPMDERAPERHDLRHDLDLANLPLFRDLPHLDEVSIGHAIMSEALFAGLPEVLSRYLKVLAP